MSAQGNSKMPWKQGYKILITNGLVSKITDGDKWFDWVHNLHLKKVEDRPDRFIIEDYPSPVIHVPRPPVTDSSAGRGMPPTQSAPSAKVTKKKAASSKVPMVQPRRSGRVRNAPSALVMDPKKKSYANAVRVMT